MTPEEYPPHITVIRGGGRFYAAVLVWDKYEERYKPNGVLGKFRITSTDAKIDAEHMGRKLEMEVRL